MRHLLVILVLGQQALADYSEAIRLDPKHSLSYFGRGNVWYGKQDLDKALADYSEAIRIDPNFTLAYIGRGLVRSARKDVDQALADYSEAIRIDPKSSDAHNQLAWIWATCPEAKFRDGMKAVASATRRARGTTRRGPGGRAGDDPL
jgi:tetratricopeptide (TPR) repeat protein